MAREQKVKSNAPQASGKGNNQASQTKAKQPEAVVAPQQQTSTIAPAVPVWPAWPTSKPGPRSTSPLPGMHSFNSFRPEQVSEIAYNQTTGEPGSHRPLPDEVGSDRKPDGQNVLGKRKKRL
jgi:hypothetical protein